VAGALTARAGAELRASRRRPARGHSGIRVTVLSTHTLETRFGGLFHCRHVCDIGHKQVAYRSCLITARGLPVIANGAPRLAGNPPIRQPCSGFEPVSAETQPVSGRPHAQISDIERSSSRDFTRDSRPLARAAQAHGASAAAWRVPQVAVCHSCGSEVHLPARSAAI
jgi:hypothetical protein